MSVQEHDMSGIKHSLLGRRAALEERRGRVERDLAHRNDPLVSDFPDQAVQRQNDETLQVIGNAAEEELAAIDEALRRIDQGLYGSCKRCDERIERARLEAVPHAVLCATCASD